MKPKTKFILGSPIWFFRNWRSRAISKKIDKFEDEDRYPQLWRNNFVLKRAKQFIKSLNVELEVIGFDNIPKTPSVLAPNHSSSLDPALILASLENPSKNPDDINHMSVFLAKKELESQKKFKGYFKILSTFFVDRKKPREAIEILEKIAQHAKEYKKHIVIFPEGTRSKNGEIGEFKGGAFRVAKKSFMPIVPVTINNALSATDLNRKSKLKIQVIFHKPLKPISFITAENKHVAKKVQEIVQSSWKRPNGSRSETESLV